MPLLILFNLVRDRCVFSPESARNEELCAMLFAFFVQDRIEAVYVPSLYFM